MKDLLIGALVLVVLLSASGVVYWKRSGNPKNAKTVMTVNTLLIFGILMTATVIMLTGGRALAAEPAAVAGAAASAEGMKYLAAALSTGMATIGAGIAVASAASAAIGAISEDASLLGKTIIFVGLAEGISIFGLLISILILQ